MKNIILLPIFTMLTACYMIDFPTLTTSQQDTIESIQKEVQPLKECDNTCTKFSDTELVKLATLEYVSTILNADYDSHLAACTTVKLLNNVSQTTQKAFYLCLENISKSTLTGYNSTLQYLINKDYYNFFNVTMRCGSSAFSNIPIKTIAYNYCI